ncbi:unnamed protein product [Allacma fusca]|uniref:Uncharacterized protein n=1 Tax=Allacma fusca TaxID=39272 RepID=A0A8J2Q1V9_9HEXA|nr:unnamed protein product [Allacma fusca]
MSKVNFAPAVDIMEMPLPPFAQTAEERNKDYEKMESVNGKLEIENESSIFLEPDKVELEIGRNGSLVISPSTAHKLCDLGRLKDSHDISDGSDRMGKTGLKKYGGMMLAFSASFFFSLTVVMVKILKDYHPLSISVWRYLGILVPSIPIVLYFQFLPEKSRTTESHEMSNKAKAVNIFQTVWPFRERDKLINFVGLMVSGFPLRYRYVM